MAAMAAKHELTQQVFTKTMAASVWRPEHERVGRHFVYTSRYVRFFMRLLLQLADKANMELLVRRVRRKTAEFFEHAKLWQDVCGAYLKVRINSLSVSSHGLTLCSYSVESVRSQKATKTPFSRTSTMMSSRFGLYILRPGATTNSTKKRNTPN